MVQRITIATSVLIIGLLFTALSPVKDLSSPDWLPNLVSQLSNWKNAHSQEKIYLHTDRTFYKPGETIWFSGYLTSGPFGDEKSGVVYVELINPRGKAEKTLTLPVRNDKVSGNFDLTDGHPGGLYKLKAYTRWMMESEGVSPFEKDIQVQAIIYPKILMKVDFEEEAYGPGETVTAEFTLTDLDGKPIAGKDFEFRCNLRGEKFLQEKSRTDQEGIAYLSFDLPESLDSNDGLLNIMVSHNGTTESISRSVPIVLNQISLDFFPEGGDLVTGALSKVAFSARDEFGEPVDIAGEIFNNQGEKLGTFSSFHMGMGTFPLKPFTGENYYVKLTKPVKSAHQYSIPAANVSGYRLALSSEKPGLTFRIFSPEKGEITLAGSSGNKLVEAHTIHVRKGENVYSVPSNSFPAGIARFTLFDGSGIPQAERLIFMHAEKQLKVEITTDREKYLPRENVKVRVKVSDESGKGMPASLSVAVVDEKNLSFADDKQDNITSWMLLSSELKGEVKEPGFYFDKYEPKSREALDLVMMTHGWRRFSWEKVKQPVTETQGPEKQGTLSGMVVDHDGNPVPGAKIALMEGNPVWQLKEVETNQEGVFTFEGISAYQITLQIQNKNGQETRIKFPEKTLELVKTNLVPNPLVNQDPEAVLVLAPEEKPVQNQPVKKPVKQAAPQDMVQAIPPEIDDVQEVQWDGVQLDEVVVVAYDVERKENQLGAAVLSPPEVNEPARVLMGKVAGVYVVSHNGGPGAGTEISIRGNAGFLPGREPLYVIDGTPMNTAAGIMGNQNQNLLDMIPAGDIEKIEILKGGMAASVYGARGANGVIIVTTKQANANEYFETKNRKLKAITFNYGASSYSRVRNFQPVYYGNINAQKRTDFRSLTYWNHDIETDKDGNAEFSFSNSDEISNFRITVEGLSEDGIPIHEEKDFYTQLPFSMTAKIPPILTTGDTVGIPVTFQNHTGNILNGALNTMIPHNLKVLHPLSNTISLDPNQGITLFLKVLVNDLPGKEKIGLKFEGSGFREEIIQPVQTISKGFPRQISVSSKEKHLARTFVIEDPLKGSVKASFTAFPDATGELLAGIESILREPHGCFEQTSSSTYPNVMVLNLLESSKAEMPEVRKKAKDLIGKGYSKLVSYETQEKGYEWFGSVPAHISLTAYGLVEFEDMSRVWSSVDQEMIGRTRNFLLNKRNGEGGYSHTSKSLDSFGGASKEITDVYVTNALVQSDEKGLVKEIDHSLRLANSSRDPYIMALTVQTLFLAGRTHEGEELMASLLKLKNVDGSWSGKSHSITRSGGSSLTVETTALAVLAMLEAPQLPEMDIHQAVKYLAGCRSNYGFGSTQATILSLKAMTGFMEKFAPDKDGGTIELSIDGKIVSELDFSPNDFKTLSYEGLEKYLGEGEHTIEVNFRNSKETIPYSLDVEWKSGVPYSSENCQVELKTSLGSEQVRVGETVRLNAEIINRFSEGLPMTMAVIGIPSGLSAQPWQLKEMQEKGRFAYYEVQDNFLYIYYRFMAPKEIKTLNFDLKAEVPGHYEGPASSSYLYYTAEYKDWEKGLEIRIE